MQKSEYSPKAIDEALFAKTRAALEAQKKRRARNGTRLSWGGIMGPAPSGGTHDYNLQQLEQKSSLKEQTRLRLRELEEQQSAPPEGVPWYIDHNFSDGHLVVYQHEVRLTTPLRMTPKKQVPGRVANDIQSFSRKSRMRLMSNLNRLRTAKTHNPAFITLTANHRLVDAQFFQHNAFQDFLRNLQKAFPGVVYIWRLEGHKDGFPHFHMVIWSPNPNIHFEHDSHRLRIKALWFKAIQLNDRATKAYSIQIKPLQSHRQVLYYVSKYIAKADASREDQIRGRRWGRSTNFDTAPILTIKMNAQRQSVIRQYLAAKLNDGTPRGKRQAEIVESELNFWLWASTETIAGWLQELLFPPESLAWFRESYGSHYVAD